MASSLDLDNAQHFPSVVFSCIVNVFSGHVHVVLAKLCKSLDHWQTCQEGVDNHACSTEAIQIKGC